VIAHQAGQNEAAIELIEHAIKLAPTKGACYYNLATIHQQRGELDLAREYALQCLRLNEQMDIAWQLLAEIDMARGPVSEEVISYTNRALAQSPQSADLHLLLAVQLATTERKQEAQKHYGRALAIFPGLESRFPDEAAQFARLMGTAPQ
jgi:tetratricopeptide (TPR) repeat protein